MLTAVEVTLEEIGDGNRAAVIQPRTIGRIQRAMPAESSSMCRLLRKRRC
jgi:hypothetical protein